MLDPQEHIFFCEAHSAARSRLSNEELLMRKHEQQTFAKIKWIRKRVLLVRSLANSEKTYIYFLKTL